MMGRKLTGLHECEHFPEFVHGAEAAGKNNQSFGHLREPELAHKKIVKKEIQLGRDIAIGFLLVRKLDAEADGRTAGFGCAAIGCLHDSRTASGTDEETAR